MKKYILQFISIVVLGIAFTPIVNAQSFEGTIEFKKETPMDTTNYVYYIKGYLVRIDEIGSKSHKSEGTFLIDMDQKQCGRLIMNVNCIWINLLHLHQH